jgi:hypothetical protein
LEGAEVVMDLAVEEMIDPQLGQAAEEETIIEIDPTIGRTTSTTEIDRIITGTSKKETIMAITENTQITVGDTTTKIIIVIDQTIEAMMVMAEGMDLATTIITIETTHLIEVEVIEVISRVMTIKTGGRVAH